MDSANRFLMPCCKAPLSAEALTMRSVILHCDRYPGLYVVRTACPNQHCSQEFTYRFNRFDEDDNFINIVETFRKLGSVIVKDNRAADEIADRYREQFRIEPLCGRLLGSLALKALQDFHREMQPFDFPWQLEIVWDDEPIDLIREVALMQLEARRRQPISELPQSA